MMHQQLAYWLPPLFSASALFIGLLIEFVRRRDAAHREGRWQ